MTQRMVSLPCIVVLFLSICVAPVWGQDDIESPGTFPGVWYRILIDANGDYIEGGGDGSGWYYYPDSDVWRMWFYNGPYDPDRKGYLNYHVYTKAVNPGAMTQVVAHFGWTTPAWSQLNRSGPPMPADMPTASDEALYMAKWRIYSVEGVITGSAETNRTCSIDEYNPEWVCIEFYARNAYIYRGAFHECMPKQAQLGACCNRQTGYCTISSEADCPAGMDWLGAGTTCSQCTQGGAAGTDFGDAPDQYYLTLRASNGARHSVVPGIFLGTAVDSESEGRPGSAATGDDNNGADEDGVVFSSTLQVGREATIDVVASTDGYLNAWVDFDGDGRFDDREDTIFVDQILTRGVNRLSFRIPAHAVPGWTFARFRFNTRGLLDSFGPADDGEVEDYRIQIVASHDAKEISGAARLTWSQPPSPAADGQAHVFQAGGATSALHLHEIAADDWQPVEGQPLTGIHWWSTFDGWTESYLPSDLPLAFHIGIWTNESDPEPGHLGTFAHPGTLVWETYCTNWTWAISGNESSADRGRPGQTCFLFSHMLSQDRWFEIGKAGSTKSEGGAPVYWLSIAALYDPTGAGPAYAWTWKTRPAASGAAGVSLETIVPPSGGLSWPPTLGAQWGTGGRVDDGQSNPADMAFQLTTFVPLEFETRASAEAVDHGPLATLAANWLNTVR